MQDMKNSNKKSMFSIFSEEKRTQRVMWLLLGIVSLSLADLTLTSMYLTSVGMTEGNPIAAWLITQTNSLWALAIYKGVTVATCVTLLYYMRTSRQGELAAWCSMLILTALSIWWNQYALYSPSFPPSEDQIVMIQEESTAIMYPQRRRYAPTLIQ
jgi:hypothetical protein